ncbi:MAG: adenylate kinase [Candidatus Nanohaloarchaeota archaeon]|nr:adenylate kinase [Candidatus Nanohaloarchaeota archaeon]
MQEYRDIVVIAGIPGVGKTTVVEEAVKKLKTYKIVNFGDVMFEIAKSEGLVKHRDDMRKLSPETQKKIQRHAAKKIAGMAADSNIIVDTHISIKTPKGYLPGLPLWVLEELEPTKIVIIDATAEEIFLRRKRDNTRRRDDESLESIKFHQRYNIYLAASYSMVSGATVSIVYNKEGKILEAVKELTSILEQD